MLTSKSFWPDAMISSLGAVQVMGSRMPISQERCQPTDFETDPLEPAQIAELVTYVSGWETVDCSTGPRLTKSFPFEDWLTAIAFVTLIAEQATFEDHHPVLTVGWGRVMAEWWTHKIYGLHRNDFIMACRTDHIFDDFRPTPVAI